MPNLNKICKKCNESKPLLEFPRSDNCRDGHRNVCIDCRSEYRKEYYHKHREHHLALKRGYRAENPDKQRQYRSKLKKDVMGHYCVGKIKCKECGFDDIRALCIDHIDGLGSLHRKMLDPKGKGRRNGAGSHMYYWLKRNHCPEGFQVLCFNCNQIKECEQRDSRRSQNA